MTIPTILLFAALICFVLAAVGVAISRLNLIAAGLACWVGSLLASGTLPIG